MNGPCPSPQPNGAPPCLPLDELLLEELLDELLDELLLDDELLHDESSSSYERTERRERIDCCAGRTM